MEQTPRQGRPRTAPETSAPEAAVHDRRDDRAVDTVPVPPRRFP
ncbi:hypothetical protein [Streptomyces lonarensis]